jgi:hypothetical protein
MDLLEQLTEGEIKWKNQYIQQAQQLIWSMG